MPIWWSFGREARAERLAGVRALRAHGGTKNEYSSWGGGIMHQTHTYGDVKIVR